MVDPKDQTFSNDNYSDDKNDALRREDNTEDIREISGDDISIDADIDRLQQADDASKPSYELNLDDETDKD
ncbi:MAG: hypothetical protein H7325_00675 [Pedobacter sp.]|nr:hypothetical protein [Pedobacter sp.]